ncbi:sigma-54 dependent transcriptional regulator [Hydrogenivirga sp. 128-5-R1-1]|uniref:sigma-54-dependent transcriptional regulator n=1 Tax=Hydrogenivirga sp. 128-5-R1-1 TaxID=392423 RepID=UPI00015F186F|nr:sigma-54 dependent transcriptional regulator [Hydrogenivirga sp. 128-5-R1-1]EDP75355.1 transcriptional regulator (NtrC family) protein [Hydrogenivirga sp. 128-5-R1-1]
MRVLVVEDEKDFRELLTEHLRGLGYQTEGACDLEEAYEVLEERDFSVVLLDLFLPDGNGMELLKWIRENSALTEVVVITGHGTIKTAVEAIKLGAYDFLTKPCSLKEVEITIKKAVESRGIKRENLLYKKEKRLSLDYGGFVFESRAMKEVIEKVDRIACSDCPVLITGESGVGKEVIASIIHRNSDRADKPMVALNIASIPKELIEAELFGYEKGAFTGADSGKEGFFELADGSTLFLDEIGEMDMSLQAKLLRAIETSKFYRIGGRREIESNVRIITATNRHLGELVRRGEFREDLYYRLNVVEINIPPLRERREDILPLAYHFLDLFNRKYSKNIKGFTARAENSLTSYPWYGNVRELKNIVERAVLFSDGDRIDSEDISCLFTHQESKKSFKTIKDVEREYITEILKQVNFNKRKASEILGIPLRTLYRKLESYGIE